MDQIFNKFFSKHETFEAQFSLFQGAQFAKPCGRLKLTSKSCCFQIAVMQLKLCKHFLRHQAIKKLWNCGFWIYKESRIHIVNPKSNE